MFYVIDKNNKSVPISVGFKSASEANKYAKKNLPRARVRLWGEEADGEKWKSIRYYVTRRYGKEKTYA